MPLPLLALVGIGLVAAAPSVLGGITGSNANKAAASAARDQADAEAAALRRAAKAEGLNWQQQEMSLRYQSERRMASIEASYAKGGVLLEGTPGNVLREQAALDEIDIQQQRRASDYTQRLYRWQARNAKLAGANLAASYQAQAKSAMIQGAFGGLSSGLSAATGAAGGLSGLGGALSAAFGGGAAAKSVGGAANLTGGRVGYATVE